MAATLHGRDDVLRLVGDACHRLSGGEGAFVCLVGEPGIGKTSVLAAIDELVEASGLARLAATADAVDLRRPAGVLRGLVPEVGDAADPLERFVAEIGNLAARGPLAVLVDDAQWADDLSLDTLRVLARQAGELGLLVVLALRASARQPAALRLIELAESVEACVRLEPLGPEELIELAGARIGVEPGPGLIEALASTAGNPFLAVELLDGLAGDGRIAPVDGRGELTGTTGLPDNVSRRLALRCFGLVPEGDGLLRAVAVAVGGATIEELAEVLGLPTPEVMALAVTAVEASVLVDDGSRLRFRHDLLRRAVLSESPGPILSALARRLVAVLSARSAAPERIIALQLEWADPADPADVDRLVELGLRHRRADPNAGADLLGAALGGLPRSDPRRIPLVHQLGWSLVDAGRASEVLPILDEQLGAPSTLDTAEVRQLRAMAAALSGRFDVLGETLGGLALDDIDRWADGRDGVAVDAVAELAFLAMMAARADDATAMLAWVAEAETEAPSTPFRESIVATTRSWLATMAGRFDDGAVEARTAVAAAERDEERSSNTATPTLVLFVCLDHLGRSAESRARIRQAMNNAGSFRWATPMLHSAMAVSWFWTGDWDDALAEIEAGHRAAEDADVGLGAYWPHSITSLIALARGDVTEARAQLDDCEASTTGAALGYEMLLAASCQVAEAEGEVAAAVELVEEVLAGVDLLDAPALLVNGGPDMAWLCREAERSDLAGRLAAGFERLAGRTTSPVVAAYEAWTRGVVEGRADEVVAAAERLLDVARRPAAARALSHGAVLHARAGAEDEARNVAARAFELIGELGAERWRRELQGRLREAGIDMRPRRRTPRPPTGWGSLTDSERAVVDLVAEGLSNSEVAERLYVSRRTVESHLGRVYRKLELRSRAQLAAEAASAGGSAEAGSADSGLAGRSGGP